MGVPTSEVGYTSATTGRGVHEVHKGHVVTFEKTNLASHPFLFGGRGEGVLGGTVVKALRYKPDGHGIDS
jgi:hypothetical protein